MGEMALLLAFWCKKDGFSYLQVLSEKREEEEREERRKYYYQKKKKKSTRVTSFIKLPQSGYKTQKKLGTQK